MTTLGFIDFVIDIIANNVPLNLEQLIKGIIQFAVKNPFNSFLTSIILIPLFAVALYSFIERATDFIAKFGDQETRQKNRVLIILVLSISTFFSILLVDNIVKGESPRPEFMGRNNEKLTQEKVTIVDELIKLKWEYTPEQREKERPGHSFGYALQASENKNFRPVKEEFFTEENFKYIKSKEPPAKLYWQVTPGYLREKDQKFIKTNSPSNPLKILHYDSIISRIASEQEIKVCTSRTGEQSFLTYEDGNSPSGLQGLEVELVDGIANSIIVDPHTTQKQQSDQDSQHWVIEDERDLDTIFRKIGRGECDLAVASLSITEDRENEYKLKFSIPYYETNLGLIINQKRHDELVQKGGGVDLLKLLSGKTVGVLKNSTSAKTIEIFNKLLRKQSVALINSKIVTEVSEALLNLDSANPTLDFVLADEVYAKSFIAKNKKNLETLYKLEPDLYPSGFPPELIGENYGIAVNYRASTLLEKINQTIDNLDQKGKLQQMITFHKDRYDSM